MSDEVEDDDNYPQEKVPLNLIKGVTNLNHTPKMMRAEKKQLPDVTETESVILGDISEDETAGDSRRVTKDFKDTKACETVQLP